MTMFFLYTLWAAEFPALELGLGLDHPCERLERQCGVEAKECTERVRSDAELYALDLEVETGRAQLLTAEADLWKARAWTWGMIGVVGWGLAVGFMSAWLSK